MKSITLVAFLVGLALYSGTVFAAPFAVGDVFAGTGSGKIDVYSSTGVFKQTLDTSTGSREQTGMCFDSSGNLYATSWTAGKMSKFNNNGVLLTSPWGGPFSSHPESCVVDASGNIYTGEVDGLNEIRKFNPDGTTLLGSWSPATEFRGLDWIDLAADQCTMYYTSEGTKVLRYNVCTSTQLPDFATGLERHCYALRIRNNGEVMVACSNKVYRLSSTGTIMQTYPKSDYGETSFLFAMNLDPDGTSFWTGGYSTGHIYKIDIATGSLLTSFTAPPRVSSMAGLAVYGEITVSRPECNDGIDNDGDGLIDYPDDPGCDSLDDTDETNPTNNEIPEYPTAAIPAGIAALGYLWIRRRN